MARIPSRSAAHGGRRLLWPERAPSRSRSRGAAPFGGRARVGGLLLALLILGASPATAGRPTAPLGDAAADDRAGDGRAHAPRTPPSLDAPWRARGMAFLDLPLGLRARYEARALHRFGALNDGSARFAELLDDANRRATSLLESRFALTRALAPHVELELAWAARSPLSIFDLTRIEDQRVAAMIRFAP